MPYKALWDQFTQTDPMDRAAGDPSMLPYVAGGDDPTVYTDPSGSRKKQNIAGIEQALLSAQRACHGQSPFESEPRLGGKLDAVEFCATAVGVASGAEESSVDSDFMFNLNFTGYELFLSKAFTDGTRHPAQYKSQNTLHVEVTCDFRPGCSSNSAAKQKRTSNYRSEGGGPCKTEPIWSDGLVKASSSFVTVVSGVAAWERGGAATISVGSITVDIATMTTSVVGGKSIRRSRRCVFQPKHETKLLLAFGVGTVFGITGMYPVRRAPDYTMICVKSEYENLALAASAIASRPWR